MTSGCGRSIAVLLVLCCTFALAQDSPQQILATVGDFNVTPSYVDYFIRNHFARGIMEQIIRQRVIQDEASAQGIRVSHEDVSARVEGEKSRFSSDEQFLAHVRRQSCTLKGYREQLQTEMVLDRLMNKAASVTDEEALAYFVSKQQDFGTEPELHIFDIVVASQDDALVAYRAVSDGTPFGVVARRFGVPNAPGKNGDLGWVTQTTIPVPALWEVADALEGGQMTEPFELGGKYHIVKLGSRRMGGSVRFEQAKDDIKAKLRAEKGLTREDYVTGLLAKAKVNVSWSPVAYLAKEYGQLSGLRVTLNGEPFALDPAGYVTDDGVAMVPAKPILRATGATLLWRPGPKILQVKRGDTKVDISLGEKACAIDGEFRNMKAPAVLRDGTTFIPTETVLGALAVNTDWNPTTRVLALTTVLEAAPEQ